VQTNDNGVPIFFQMSKGKVVFDFNLIKIEKQMTSLFMQTKLDVEKNILLFSSFSICVTEFWSD
jgi:hypothetical protein